MEPLSCLSQFILWQQSVVKNNYQEKQLSHLFMPLGCLQCLQLKCLPCRRANYFVEAPCFLASHHTNVLLVSAKFCVPVFVHVHVVYTGQWSRSGRPGDHWTNVLTADPLFADEKHTYCLHRSVSTQTSQSERKRDLKMSRFWARWPLWHSWLVLLGTRSRLTRSKTPTSLCAPLLHVVLWAHNRWCQWTLISMCADVKRIRKLLLCQN